MNADSDPLVSRPVLGAVLRVMAPLVRWLIRSGIGYTEFAGALKLVFLDQAQRELERTGGKPTDSALSLLAGLHRKDIRKIAAEGDAFARSEPNTPSSKASLASQVVARWLTAGLPETLPVTGDSSFEALARSVSVDVHPRAVMQELQRLGIAQVYDQTITLEQQAFVADPTTREAQFLVADGLADHAYAGVHNLTNADKKQFLEQAVFADGLSRASALVLEKLATDLWHDVMTRMVQTAVPLCDHDEPLGGDHRLRLGMYCYSEPTPPTTPPCGDTQNETTL